MVAKKQKIGLIYKLGAWLAFIMIAYLSLRGYRNSVEKLKTDACISEISELILNIQNVFGRASNYAELNYKTADSLKVIPKKMYKEGYREALNSYNGGIDFWYSAISETLPYSAFEISFQGLSSKGCQGILKASWNGAGEGSLVAIAGFGVAKPSGVLDEIYPGMTYKDIKMRNVFLGNDASFASDEKLSQACSCIKDDCTVVLKFR